VPTKAIWESNRMRPKKRKKGLAPTELRIFTVLCSYANNQGFSWPNALTIAEVCDVERPDVTKALTKAQRLGYIEKVSKFRSHPKWRHVMGTVWRIVYDDRLDQEELIDAMNKDDPAPIVEEDLGATGNHEVEEEPIDLALVMRVARGYATAAEAATGELRLVNPRAVENAEACLKAGMTEDQINERYAAWLDDCRKQRRSAPQHLGFLLN